jgi:hypothetical protein
MRLPAKLNPKLAKDSEFRSRSLVIERQSYRRPGKARQAASRLLSLMPPKPLNAASKCSLRSTPPLVEFHCLYYLIQPHDTRGIMVLATYLTAAAERSSEYQMLSSPRSNIAHHGSRLRSPLATNPVRYNLVSSSSGGASAHISKLALSLFSNPLYARACTRHQRAWTYSNRREGMCDHGSHSSSLLRCSATVAATLAEAPEAELAPSTRCCR